MRKIKIMVVDDSSTIRSTSKIFLEAEGYEVVITNDGFEALYKVIEEKPDLIFIDVLMPKVDGIEACQIIRRNPEFKKVPIIFLSSKDGKFDIARGLMVGADDYLTKPFSKVQILDVVKKHTAHLADDDSIEE